MASTLFRGRCMALYRTNNSQMYCSSTRRIGVVQCTTPRYKTAGPSCSCHLPASQHPLGAGGHPRCNISCNQSSKTARHKHEVQIWLRAAPQRKPESPLAWHTPSRKELCRASKKAPAAGCCRDQGGCRTHPQKAEYRTKRHKQNTNQTWQSCSDGG